MSDLQVTCDGPITLTQVLKLSGCADSGGAAKQMIESGQVRVNGAVELRKRRQMVVGDVVELALPDISVGQRIVVARA